MTLNRAMLIGHLGRDPEVRYTRSGDPVANFSIATTRRWRDKQGEMQEKTDWHNCVVWRKLAELAQNYLHKGSKVYIEGRLETREWTDNENIKRYRTEINVDNLEFLDRKEGGSGGGGGSGSYDQRPPRNTDQKSSQQSSPPPQGGAENDEPYIDDDIPF